MRLVIPYRLPADGGIELKYAIRSMVKHFKPLSGVLLIGDKPEWYTGDHLPYADLKGEKERSMQLKVLRAPDEVFLYSNDDYFALENFYSTFPNYYDTTCRDLAERHPIASYREIYNNCLPSWLNYDVHTPMLMTRQRFKAAYHRMDAQTPIKTTYGNFQFGLIKPPVYLCDMKIRGPHSDAEIEYSIKDRPFFSTHDSAINEAMISIFEKLYPDASIFEK
jgi:hypothetical protein